MCLFKKTKCILLLHHISDIVLRLTNTVGTKDDAVRTAVSKSLQSLGLKQPEFVLALLMQFLTDNKKVSCENYKIISFFEARVSFWLTFYVYYYI